jgi:hypothetical protein
MVNCFSFFFIPNTSIVRPISINFRANLDAQNAGNCISGLQISKMFLGSRYVGQMAIPYKYIISQKGPFSKNGLYMKILPVNVEWEITTV